MSPATRSDTASPAFAGANAHATAPEAALGQQILDLQLFAPIARRFDNFIPGANAHAVAALRRACDPSIPPDPAVIPIYVWGPPGSGRSHLLAAAQHAAPAGSILTVDDVDTLDDAAQIDLFNAINQARHQGGQPLIVIAGAHAPMQTAVREDLRSRLGWGLVFRLQALSDAQCRLAMTGFAESRGFALDPRIVDYLMVHHSRDVGALLATLDALDRLAVASARAPRLPLLLALLQAAARDPSAAMPTAPAMASSMPSGQGRSAISPPPHER